MAEAGGNLLCTDCDGIGNEKLHKANDSISSFFVDSNRLYGSCGILF
jgi:hypothetical protein